MKNIILFSCKTFLVVIFNFLGICNSLAQVNSISNNITWLVKNDLRKENIYGNIKTIIDIKYGAPSASNDEKQKIEWVETDTYNQAGNFICKYGYAPDRGLFRKDTFRYDTRGNLIEKYSIESVGMHNLRKSLKPTDTLMNKSIFKYDTNNFLIEEDYYSPRFFRKTIDVNNYKGENIKQMLYDSVGILYCKFNYVYDSTGDKTVEYWHESDSTQNRKMVFRYNKNGNAIDGKYYNGKDILWGNDNYTYDEKSNLILYKFFNANGTQRPSVSNQYEDFDSNGNWMSKTEIMGNLILSITKRTIKYY